MGASLRSAWACGLIVLCAAGAAEAAPRLEIEAGADTLVADGVSTVPLTVHAYLEDGRPIWVGPAPELESSLGEIVDVSWIIEGTATATLRAGTWPGTAALTAGDFVVTGDTSVELVVGDPVATTLHLHASFSEGKGTMTGQSIEAEALGVDVVWWTDHDFFYYPDEGGYLEVSGDDFESASLTRQIPYWPAGRERTLSWETLDWELVWGYSDVVTRAAHTGNFGWRQSGWGDGTATWRYQTHKLSIHPALNIKPLLAQVDLRFFARTPVGAAPDAELWVEVELSAGLDGQTNTLHFYHSSLDYSYLEGPHDHYERLTLPRWTWTEVQADLSELARTWFPDTGDDQHAELVTVKVRAREWGMAAYDLDDFEWTQEVRGEHLRDDQRAFLDGLPYTPRHLVGSEISLFGSTHLNAFGSWVPLTPYAEHDEWSLAEVVDFVHGYGGVVSYNHMFGTSMPDPPEEERAALVVEQIEALGAAGVYGCDLLEVGYRRRTGLLEDFLAVWDALGEDGVVITGIGANDLHGQVSWRDWQNRFVTWIPVGQEVEEELLRNLARGAVWFGDPVAFADPKVSATLLTAGGASMGQVVVGADTAQQVTFGVSYVGDGWTVRLLEDGIPTETWVAPAAGPYEVSTAIDPVGGNVVRFDVHTAEGQPALFTNPIYFFDVEPEGGVRADRLPAP